MNRPRKGDGIMLWVAHGGVGSTCRGVGWRRAGGLVQMDDALSLSISLSLSLSLSIYISLCIYIYI